MFRSYLTNKIKDLDKINIDPDIYPIKMNRVERIDYIHFLMNENKHTEEHSVLLKIMYNSNALMIEISHYF